MLLFPELFDPYRSVIGRKSRSNSGQDLKFLTHNCRSILVAPFSGFRLTMV